jgi:hypothetical protein
LDNSVELTLMLTPETAAKLRELTGATTISQYLTALIEKLHSEQSSSSASAEMLRAQTRAYQQELQALRVRLKNLTLSQEELLATVNHLSNISFDLSDTARRQQLH